MSGANIKRLMDPEILAAIMDSATDGFTYTDETGYIVYNNRAYSEMTGLPDEKIQGHNIHLLGMEEFPISRIMLEMFQSRESRSELIKYQADSGRLLLVTLSSVYSPDGRLPRRGGQRTGHDRADAAPPADGHHLSGLRPARLPPLSALICRLWFARSKSTTCQSATTVENKTVRESCHKNAGMYPRRDGLAAGAAQTIPCLEGGG